MSLNHDAQTMDMFGHSVIPCKIKDICFTPIPKNFKKEWSGLIVCLTGYFSSAPGNAKRLQVMQDLLNPLSITVVESWRKNTNILIVGDKARILSEKIRQAIIGDIPIIKESDLLAVLAKP